jgi:hypothetical protein
MVEAPRTIKKLSASGKWYRAYPPKDPNAPKKPRLAPGQGPPRKSRSIKARILTRESLDGRTHAKRRFDTIASGLAEDLGGIEQLSTVQVCLVEAFAGISVLVHNLNARLLDGEKIDIFMFATAVSTLVRTATRVGIHRVPRDVSTLREAMEEEVEADDLEEAAP